MSRTSLAVYRGLLRAYPRRFRDEYGDDMTLLLAEQLRDENAARVWLRALVDLAVSAPARHLEVRMKHSSPRTVPTIFATIAICGLLLAAIGGSTIGLVAIGLIVAVTAGALAAIAWRRSSELNAPSTATAQWWKYVLTGGVSLTTLIIVTTITGELPDGGWAIAMIVLLASLITLGLGLVLGILHLGSYRRRHAAA